MFGSGGPAPIGMRMAGGKRTTGLPLSAGAMPGRDITEPAGELMPSREGPGPSDDLRLMATLGEYALPP